MPKKTETVKKQRGGGRSGAGFGVNPQNINREGANDSELRWRNIFMQKAEERKGEKTRRELIADAIFDKAEKGDVPAFKEIRDTTDGKPQQSLDVTSAGEKIGGAAEVIAAIESSKKNEQ